MRRKYFIISIIVAVAIIIILVLQIAFNAFSPLVANNGLSSVDSSSESKSYVIGMYGSLEDKYTYDFQEGFSVAIDDLSKDGKYSFTLRRVGNINMLNHDNNDISLLLTIGPDALKAAIANSSQSNIPIVSGGVKNLEEFAGSINNDIDINPPAEISSHDGIFTGISSLNNMEITLSTIIEAVPHLKQVGLLCAVGDSDSTYQNSLLSMLMDEAGIGHKEYLLDLDKITIPQEGEEITTSTEDTISEDVTEDEEPDVLRDTITKAALECDILFISAGSNLADIVPYITDIAMEYSTPTMGGDEHIGTGTLVSVFSDPFDQGYRLALKAYDILIGNSKIEDIPIEFIPYNMMLKTYNPEIAGRMERTFPKSFWDVFVIINIYAPGSMTQRI